MNKGNNLGNNLEIKNLLFLSAIFGGISALFALIPHLGITATLFVLCAVCIPVIIILEKYACINLKTIKETLITGALSGFVAYMVFCLVFIPLVYILSLFFNLSYLGGLILILKMSSFGLILLFVIFVSIIAVIFNSFSSLIYYYVNDSIKGVHTGEK